MFLLLLFLGFFSFFEPCNLHQYNGAKKLALAHPHSVIFAEIDGENLQPLFILPVSEDYVEVDVIPSSHRLHPEAAENLKILDIVRLVGMIFGIPSFSPCFQPPAHLQNTTGRITVHAADPNGHIPEEDITPTLVGVSVKEWEGRVVLIKVHGKRSCSLVFPNIIWL